MKIGKPGKRGASTQGGFGAVDRYCDIAAFSDDNPVFYGHDASDCTLIEIDGVKTIIDPEEFHHNIQAQLVSGLAQILQSSGHRLSASYESNGNIEEEFDRLIRIQRRHAEQKRLAVDALIEEGAAIVERRARREKILLALWTTPEAALREEVEQDRHANLQARASMPPASNAQPAHIALRSLEGPHSASVKRVMTALEYAGLQARILGPDAKGRRVDLAEVRKAILYHETPEHWSPFGPYDRRYPGAKERIDPDTSDFFSPPVAQQILSSGAKASANLRTVSIGGRHFAVVALKVFPKVITPFNPFLETLLSSHRIGSMPFRLCFHLEDITGREFGLKKLFAGLASWTSPSTKNLFHALKTLQEVHERDHDTVLKARVLATTWVEPGEPVELLEQRRSFLVRALMTWGDATVMESPHQPMRALAETVPGMTLMSKVPDATLAPLSDIADMLPFHRTAAVFSRGETVFLSPDGKPMPHEAFSQDQNFWLTLIYATPGSGKSVLLNRLNFDFTAFSPGRSLPFVCVIDVGVSSSGYIDVIRHGLPEERAHEALYVRLRNSREHAINPFDLGLGRRYPLARETTFISTFLTTMLSIKGELAYQVEPLVVRVIKRLYQAKSDLELSSEPNTYQTGVDLEIDQQLAKLGISLSPKARWWHVTDAFMKAGRPLLAMRAQRYAMPKLEDISMILSERTMKEDFEPGLLRMAQLSVESALERYPIFSQATRLDLGEARVVSIDLQDVVDRFVGEDAERNNSLMFMAARQSYMMKISGYAEEIKSMELPKGDVGQLYRTYWQQRYADTAEAAKRLAMDEYHLTGGTEQIRKLVLSDAREGRKWGMEIILASQLLRDFQSMKDMASTVMILNADSAQLRAEAQETFGFSDAVKLQLERHVHGPKPGSGATFLVRYVLREEERWTLCTNIIGPRLLWALTTRKEDRLVRDELYKRVTVNEALRILAQRYPTGSAADHWDRVVSEATATDDRAATVIVNQIMGEVLSLTSRVSTPHKLAAE